MFSTERLRKLRLEKNMTQEELGRKLGVSKSLICLYEQGNRGIDINTFDRIVEILDTTTEYLLKKETRVVSDNKEEYSKRMPKEYITFIEELTRNKRMESKILEDPIRVARILNQK